jgi:hypothetical protein
MKNIKSIITIATLFPFLCHADQNEVVYKWQSLGKLAMLSQHLMFKISDSKALANSFILEYYPNRGCDAGASIISVVKTTPHSDKNPPKLGKYKSHDVAEATKKGNQLNFFVDGKEIKYRQEKITRAIYENGVEFGTNAPQELIKALENSSKGDLKVNLGGMELLTVKNSVGFSEANKNAYNACLNK